ncbi:ABC transporter substrate-binding protein [Mycolicibacterium goodii]|uniref:ABC transporter substrate-binding protein n=1 Tax=Mycolicibacterium goodii TaxID=134601 RepID=UPI00093FF236|nr:ABC transporter substrate-binding protein [Mycolicibacterium goodii]OKH70524.1 4,5-dihydroxyphthalate decarboxylase [Mycobacterium sp. SWH-M5]MBU8811801.1 ABC transporter substrate-binding protein [Mycolicibacterium goodii]MBU8829667.1 ABC transporter substrate-binding protein [Mycolicibacterium goodii]PJK19567.1 4,5-dihydroxyphthalate decarboxylase [Mycolicibacterium goodii]ULN50085.1 ABC transporter substrate-binding protein [Mycolicibacterium goodii]
MSRLELTFACGDYDRTRALEDGSVRPDGIELTYLRLPVEETFFRMLRHREFDVAEMSLSTYVATLDVEPRPFVALPVYTSRMFRHGGIYINADAGIRAPSDLVGKRIGAPEFQLTAGVWIRGILDEHHGVPIDSVTYYTGGQETPGRIEKGKVDTGLDIRPIPDGATLSQMLADGEIDALHTPRVPSTFRGGDPRVKRLFPDVVTVEKEYFAATGIFPIMHVVVIRSDIYDRHPWVAQSLYKAFLTARDDAYARIYDSSALRFMEPWLIQHLEDAKQLLGQDYWSYGLAENHTTLDVFLRYHHEQGLSRKRYEPADLFARETAESFVI